ncbi:MAG: phosphopantetheine-binding protein [Bacteroidales bacterium]|jgi:acyl carrier protein|nr:phosphopantetheine-binding protein [Bacteroidales bacterium]
MDKENLIEQLKAQIIEALSLEDVKPADIDPNAPLFVEGLGLDSIDALELILLLEKQYGIKVEDPQKRRDVLQSVASMADYILTHSPKL